MEALPGDQRGFSEAFDFREIESGPELLDLPASPQIYRFS
jgi:hypothetical protein